MIYSLDCPQQKTRFSCREYNYYIHFSPFPPPPPPFFFFFFFFVPCGKFGSPYLGKTQQPQEQRHPFLSVCAVFSCVKTMVWLPVFGILCVCVVGGWVGERERDSAQMVMHAIAHGGCTDTVRGSALEADSGRKIVFAAPGTRTLLNITPGFFSQTLYPLSYPGPKYIPCRTATEVGSQRTCSINFHVDIQNGLRNRKKKKKKKWNSVEGSINSA